MSPSTPIQIAPTGLLTVRQDLAEEGNVVRRRWLQWVSHKGETGAGES